MEISKAAQKVFVAFRDDGRGLNRDQILQKAKEKGLLKKPESEYEDSEIYAFLLRPGFTTKASATMFSGRGVGLDVVNAAVASWRQYPYRKPRIYGNNLFYGVSRGG